MAGTNFDQAMERLRDEMAKHTEHPGICAIGEHLTARLERQPHIAQQLLDQGKSLANAYHALEKEARSRAKGRGGCVVISDSEGFQIAEKYYGIPADADELPADAGPAPEPAANEEKPWEGLNLDNLLAGL